MSNKVFDAEGFYSALENTRIAKRLTWKQVAETTGVTASTLTRMGQGKRPDADGLAALATWADLDIRRFNKVSNRTESGSEPLAEISALLRADRNLSSESAKALNSMIQSAYEAMRNSK